MPPAQPCAALTKIAATAGDTPTLNGLVKAATRLSRKPDLVRSRLDHLRSHPERLKEIADQSYVHSNGFAKVKMFEGHGVCVRLHIWPAGEKRVGDVDPHGHRWEFASWVAVGPGMTETYFAESDHGEAVAYDRFDYGRDAEGSGYLRERGWARLWSGEPQRRHAGTVYGCHRKILHTVAPVGDELVATVVLQGPVVADSARVYRRPGQCPGTGERPIEVDELDALFDAVDTAVRARAGRWRSLLRL